MNIKINHFIFLFIILFKIQRYIFHYFFFPYLRIYKPNLLLIYKVVKCSHILSPLYPSTWNSLGYWSSWLNKGSIVSLNASSSILGISISNNGELNSIHGFVFTSINQNIKSESIIKSNPNISKQNFLSSKLIFFLTDYIVI